jgi:hypothetical protein
LYAVATKKILSYDMAGKQQQNNTDDYNPKNNMLYFFHDAQPPEFVGQELTVGLEV